MIDRIRRFSEEAWSELKKVAWPTRTQVRNLTILVFVISGVVGLYITALDWAFSEAIRLVSANLG
ncbi:MAG: preprotein translocase subunit SecE [Chloroflexi bacterium]|nr:preprotein translocase subunit SecE [Chloroflexota bacterium]